jgi:hypothetical protein
LLQNGRHRPHATSATDLQPASGRGPVPANNRRVQRKKNGNWTDAQLEKALSAITDDGLKIREAARVYNIPATSLRNHLWGTTNGRHRGICPTLKHDEELKLVEFIFKMQEIGYPLTPTDLRVKVAQAIQARQTPWSATGLPGSGWLRGFRRRHPEISLRKSQELAVARARNMCPATVAGFYANLEYLYSLHNYPESHIWNCDESGVQATKNGGATVLAKKGSKMVNSITPDHREHISVLSCINAAGGKIPNFYIVKGKYFTANHIRGCEHGAVMGVQYNAWMTKFLFESWIAHFLRNLNKGPGVSQQNRHLLILDGHTSHVTIEVTKTCMNNGIDIVTLPSHTSHALLPLDRTCFAPFKTAFRRIRDDWIRHHKNTKVDKSMLCEWTSKALGQALTPSNIKAGFRRCGIWPLNKTTTLADMGPAEGFQTEDNVAASRDAGDAEDVEEGSDHEEGYDGEGGLRTSSAARLRSPSIDLREVSSPEGDDGEENPEPFYYVNVPDADESTHEVQDMSVNIDPDFQTSLHLQQQEQNFNSFLALPEVIPARKRKRQQPLLDFTKSKILTSEEYIDACEQLLAKRQENEAAAKRKAEERAANKESRRREKEERVAGINERKAQRQAKRLEKERLQAEKRVGGGRRGRRPPAARIAADTAEADPGGEGREIHRERGDSDPAFTTPPSAEQGPLHSFQPFFNPQLQLPSSSTAFQRPNTSLWPSPPQIFYNPMLMSSFFPPTTASFNASDRNGNAG